MTRAPIVPVPKTPRVLPRSCVRRSRGQAPARTSRSMRGIRRAVASMSASVCSATAKALTPGVLDTVMPWRPAAARSTLSVPVPQIEISSSLRHAAITLSVNRAWARMLMATRASAILRISSASSSAPRAVKTCVSPIFLQRSCAGVPLKTDGKSSGMVIVTGDLRSALIEGGLTRGRPGSASRLSGVGEGRLGGGDAGAGLALVPEVAERQLERRQGRQHVVRAGGHGHRADAQGARAHLVEAGADQDAILVPHPSDDGGRIDALRRLHARHGVRQRSEEHTSELQSPVHLVCRLLLEKKKTEAVDTSGPLSSRAKTLRLLRGRRRREPCSSP